MTDDTLRRQIALEAARLLYSQQEADYSPAKVRAGRRICRGPLRPGELPTNREIGAAIGSLIHGSADHDAGAVTTILAAQPKIDRFGVYRMLLLPLQNVKQSPERHPEGDALYHSLQVFDLAQESQAYDEELQLAALLHDVGKAIDPRDPVAAGLEALGGSITARTAWLIEHLAEAEALREGRLGVRSQCRLESAEDFADLMLLCDCNRLGRKKGVAVPEMDEALASLRDLAQSCDEG